MFTVLLNDKKYDVEDGTPLEEIASLYDETLSKREITSDEVSTADITAVDRNLVLSCALRLPLFSETVTCITVEIDDDFIDVGFFGENSSDVRTIKNPLSLYGNIGEKILAWETGENAFSGVLSDAIGKKISDLSPSFDQSQPPILVVCAGEFYLRTLLNSSPEDTINTSSLSLGFPVEKTFLIPPADMLTSGRIFCESARYKENAFLIGCEDNLTILYIDKETATYALMWEFDYSPLSLLAFRAALRVLTPEKVVPYVYLYGKHAYDVEEAVSKEHMPFAHAEKDPSSLHKFGSIKEYRSLLENEKRRASFHDLLKDERFQEILTEISVSD